MAEKVNKYQVKIPEFIKDFFNTHKELKMDISFIHTDNDSFMKLIQLRSNTNIKSAPYSFNVDKEYDEKKEFNNLIEWYMNE